MIKINEIENKIYLPVLRENWFTCTFRTRVPSVAVNLNLQYGFKFGNVKTLPRRKKHVRISIWNRKANTLNCSSEQIRTLCEVNVVDEISGTFSEWLIDGIGTFEVIGTDSIVEMPEPCPINWLEPSSTTMLNTGALCFNRISFAKTNYWKLLN